MIFNEFISNNFYNQLYNFCFMKNKRVHFVWFLFAFLIPSFYIYDSHNHDDFQHPTIFYQAMKNA